MYVHKQRNDYIKKYFYTVSHTNPVTGYMTSNKALGFPLKTRKVNPEASLYTETYWWAYGNQQRLSVTKETPKFLLKLM